MPLDLFSKTPIPASLPKDMLDTVIEINSSIDKYQALEKSYKLIAKKYTGHRIKTYLLLPHIFTTDINTLWERDGFMHCCNINYVLRVLLVSSNFFRDDEIKIIWTQIWYISPHQYLKVKIQDTWIDIDIWAAAYGITLGNHAHGFR